MNISRRQLLTSSAALGAASLMGPARAILAPKPERFRFIHFTDLHIQPELGAVDGVALAVKKILSLTPRPDFVVTGGDHVMDVLSSGAERAELQFKLLAEALKPLEMPIYSVIGNHDVYGWGDKNTSQTDPLYGKKMIEERLLHAKSYRSFNHKGWHFALLDSIQPSSEGGWRGAVDEAQMEWLKADLKGAGEAPKVLVTHVPAITAFTALNEKATGPTADSMILSNGTEIAKLAQTNEVKAVLQGHTHIVEEIEYAEVKYVTGGAVCGDWWKGYRLGLHPEGFLVCDLSENHMSQKYVTYGWKARKA